LGWPPSHRPHTPDHAVRKQPGEVTLDVQGAVGEVAVGNQCVVAVCIQRPYLRRVFAPPLSWSATTARWAMSLEPELPADAHGPVTTTVTRRIKPGHEAAYEAFLAGISGAARAFPGYLGIEVFRPTPSGHGGEYRTVYRFDSLAHLHGWLDSPERAAWLQRAEPHVAGPMRTQVLTGLEGWFTLPTQPGLPPPPRYKMAVLTWATIFPLITLVVVATAPLLGSLPLVVRLAVTTGVTVPLMTWVVMPRVTRLLHRWLYPDRR
jgi:antibiotic biosynthesis monooxygenase (ABM) superfamily enzyme